MKRGIVVLVGTGILAIIVATIALYHGGTQTRTCRPAGGKMTAFQPAVAPQVVVASFVDGDGKARTVADLRGEGPVLDFWATWRAPCVKEMPILDRQQVRLGGRGGTPGVRAFYAEHGIGNLGVAIDDGLRAARALHVKGLPTTVLIGDDGRERGRLVGAAEWDSPDAVALIKTCLGGKG